MANITTDQFIAAFNAAFPTDADALNAITGLGFQWRSLVAEAQARAAREKAQTTSQAAEQAAQAADQKQQAARVEFVRFVAGIG